MTAAGDVPPAVPAPAAVVCEDVWQIFGADASRQLARIRAEMPGDAQAIAGRLVAQRLVPAIRGVSFDVREGEVFVIMGLSGSGKSTLIRCITRLIDATDGVIRIAGEDIMAASRKRLTDLRRDKLGMVFQHFGLFPHMTVADNIGFPLKMQGKRPADRRHRVLEVIDMVGLAGREDAYPRELSGGQRQRVGIARSLAVDPDLWFLDEPFSALDPLIRRQLQDEFLKIQASLKKTAVFITHDIAEAVKLADRIAIMRDGVMVQIGTPAEILLDPVDDYVRAFSRDVPKGQYARVATLMHRPDRLPEMPDDPKLRADMTIDAALAACMSLYQLVPVRDRADALVGYVHPRDLARALQVDEP